MEGGAATNIAVGAGVLLLAPSVLPVVGRALRPVAVGLIKTGMTVYNQTATTVRETTEDLMAEARAELEAQQGTEAPPPRRHGRSSQAS